MARDTRPRKNYADPRDWPEQEAAGDVPPATTYYLVPPHNEFQQSVPAPASPKRMQRQADDNLVQIRKNRRREYEGEQLLRALPGLARRRGLGTLFSFLLLVVLPTLAAFIYYSSIASPQYVAEFRFSVKDTSATAAPASPSLLTALGAGAQGPSMVENYLVVDYLTSRQAVDDLQKQMPLIDFYARPNIDSWSRFDPSQPIERFIAYWKSMVTANYDHVTGIATAQVRAFAPEDALAVADALVALSEELVNRISTRTRLDTVRFAEGELEKAQERVRRVRAQLIDRTSSSAPGGSAQAGAHAALLLDLERQTAQNMLASTMQSLEQARANALTQHLYITPFVRPSLPQSAAYPRVFVSTMTTAAIAFMIWVVGLLTLRAIFDR